MPERDKSFATFASAWCAGYIARREGLHDQDRQAFAAKLLRDYDHWSGGEHPSIPDLREALRPNP